MIVLSKFKLISPFGGAWCRGLFLPDVGLDLSLSLPGLSRPHLKYMGGREARRGVPLSVLRLR